MLLSLISELLGCSKICSLDAVFIQCDKGAASLLGGRERWQLLAGVCAGGAVCGVTALSWCWNPPQPHLGRDIWKGGLHLVLSFVMDNLPEAAAAWEPQRWCSKRIIVRTGCCMAKPVLVDVQEDTGVCQAQLPLSLAPGIHPNP